MTVMWRLADCYTNYGKDGDTGVGGGGGRREFWQWYLCGIGVRSGNDSQVEVGISYGDDSQVEVG